MTELGDATKVVVYLAGKSQLTKLRLRQFPLRAAKTILIALSASSSTVIVQTFYRQAIMRKIYGSPRTSDIFTMRANRNKSNQIKV
jgi:hypothetical protein